MLKKIAIIKRLPDGQYHLYSRKKDPKTHKRKNLGTFDSLEAAKKREKQIQFFKSHSDDGQADDHETKMLGDLSDIAGYLENAGFIDQAKQVYNVMNLIDGSLEDYLLDPYIIPDAQKNTENQGYIGGESPISNSYTALNAGESQPAEDSVNLPGINGLMNNSVTDDQYAGMFNVLNDSYFYSSLADRS